MAGFDVAEYSYRQRENLSVSIFVSPLFMESKLGALTPKDLYTSLLEMKIKRQWLYVFFSWSCKYNANMFNTSFYSVFFHFIVNWLVS